MQDQDFISLYGRLFAGRPDTYAIRWEFERDGKTQAIYVPHPYTGTKDHVREYTEGVANSIRADGYGPEAIRAHLTGEAFLGVYPIWEDSTVRFFALDFDKEPAIALQEAIRQREILLQEARIETYIECSRSGNGYHLWGFLDEPVNAGVLRHALARFIEDADTYDRMFPNQDSVSEARPLGNLIALPLYGPTVREGKGAFLMEFGTEWGPALDQKAFLSNVSLIEASRIHELSNTSPLPKTAEAIPYIREGKAEGSIHGAYKLLHSTLGCEWMRWAYEHPEEVTEPDWYAVACQCAQLDGGRELFHEISAQDISRYDARTTDVKFDHAVEQNAPHTCAYIRENLNGPGCNCDLRDLDITHPYDLAKIPFYDLIHDLPEEGSLTEAHEGMLSAIDWVRENYRNPGVTVDTQYGIEPLDKLTTLRPSDLVIVAARPGIGKTAFALDVAQKAAKAGKPIYIFSMEMASDQLWRRVLAAYAGVNATRMKKGELSFREWRRLLKAEYELKRNPLPIYVDDGVTDSEQVINRAAELVHKHGPGVVMIDYLQLAAPKQGESMYEMNSRLPREYKLMAKALNVPVVCLAQMNRSGDDATDRSETFDSMLEGSGKIEQAADVILYLLGPKGPGIVSRTIVLHKDRHGENSHRIPVDFHQPLMTFKEQGAWAHQKHKDVEMPTTNTNTSLSF